jgi:histone demethylase JARID1
MLFSSFSFHFEDHNCYSIKYASSLLFSFASDLIVLFFDFFFSYVHAGAQKCWYGVPSAGAGLLDAIARAYFPALFRQQPDLLFSMVTMFSPSMLRAHGVPMYTTLQEPGQFVITFPQSYHAGFNCGFNVAEAVRFACHLCRLCLF